MTYIDQHGLPIIVTNSTVNSQVDSLNGDQSKASVSALEHINSLFEMTDIESSEKSQDTSEVEETEPSHTSSMILKRKRQVENTAQSEAKIESTTSMKTVDEQYTTDYFLPRVNSTFTEDLLQCVTEFKVTKESLTNSKTWHTVHEIVIIRM